MQGWPLLCVCVCVCMHVCECVCTIMPTHSEFFIMVETKDFCFGCIGFHLLHRSAYLTRYMYMLYPISTGQEVLS